MPAEILLYKQRKEKNDSRVGQQVHQQLINRNKTTLNHDKLEENRKFNRYE